MSVDRDERVTGTAWMMAMIGPASALALALIVAGCDGSGSAGDAVVVRDSSGVRIVESRDHGQPAPLIVEHEPALRIGALDGPPDYTFRTITAARRLADGRLVVADVDQVRIYDAEGGHLSTSGRAGDGPGEFRRIRAIAICGDEVVVGDFMRPALSAFRLSDGALRRVLPLPPSGEPFPFLLESCTPEGAPLLRSPNAVVAGIEGDASMAWLTLLRLDDAGDGTAALDTLLRVPSHMEPRGLPAPFARSTLLAYGDTVIHAVDTGGLEVHSYGLDGILRRVARVPVAARPVTAGDVEREREAAVEGFPEPMREQLRASMQAGTSPSTMPVVSRIRTDPDGRLWLRPYRPRAEPEDTVWLVLGLDGALAGRVAIPAGLAVHEVGRDYLLGVWRDELDVAYVQLHQIRYPEDS